MCVLHGVHFSLIKLFFFFSTNSGGLGKDVINWRVKGETKNKWESTTDPRQEREEGYKEMKDNVQDRRQEVKDRERKQCVGCDGWSWKGGEGGGMHVLHKLPLRQTLSCAAGVGGWWGVCVRALLSICVCMPHVPWVWGPVGGWQIICREAGWRGPSLSLSLFYSSFSTVTHLLAPLRTAQGHRNTAKVWKVHDTRSSRVSQHFSTPLLVSNSQTDTRSSVNPVAHSNISHLHVIMGNSILF